MQHDRQQHCRQVPIADVVRAVAVGLLAFGLLSLSNVLIFFYAGSLAVLGRIVMLPGLALIAFALYRTLAARLNTLWLVSLLTAFTGRMLLQGPADLAIISSIDLYRGQVDPVLGWFVLASMAGVVALIGRAGMVLGVARE